MFNENGNEIKSDYDGSCDCEIFNRSFTDNYNTRSELHLKIKDIFLDKNITKENIENFINYSTNHAKLFGKIHDDGKPLDPIAISNFKKASNFSKYSNEVKNFISNSIKYIFTELKDNLLGIRFIFALDNIYAFAKLDITFSNDEIIKMQNYVISEDKDDSAKKIIESLQLYFNN